MDSTLLYRVRLFSAGVALSLILLFAFENADADAVGRTVGDFSVSDSGEAQYTIPLYTPPGTNGLKPDLTLTYSSNKGPGMFGVGWSATGFSSIYRCNSTWTQNGVARDVRNDMSDAFCLDGNQLRLTSGPGTYGSAGSTYQTEIETFTKVTAYGPQAGNGPGYFVARRKDGLEYTYGGTGDSQILSLGQTTARTWAVNRISDRAGNSIAFTYTEDTTLGSFRPYTIEYTRNDNAGVAGAYLITFSYEDVPVGEIDSKYVAGSAIRRITRVKQIDITQGSTFVRSYRLGYEPLSSTLKSRLSTIQECAGPTLPLECYPGSTFTYQNGTAGVGGTVATGVTGTPYMLPFQFDLNGDGRKDLVYSSNAPTGTWMYSLADSSGNFGAALSTGVASTNYATASSIDYNSDGKTDLLMQNGTGTWWVMQGTAGGLGGPVNTSAPLVGKQTRAIDVDGDGLQDLVWRDGPANYAAGDVIKYRLRIAGGAFSTSEITLAGPMPVDTKIFSAFSIDGTTPDFNGDGRGDVTYITDQRVWNDGNGTWLHFTRLNVLLSGGGSYTANINMGSQPYFAELNGDGRTDIAYFVAGTSPAWRARYSTGTSFTAEIAGPAFSATIIPFLFMDWDGDGIDDFLSGNSAGTLILYRSTGVNFASGVSTGLTGMANCGIVTDTNGDGLQDLICGNQAGPPTLRFHSGVTSDLLQTAKDGFNNQVTFNYAPLTTAAYTRGSTAAFPEQDYQGPMSVVSSAVASDGIGGTYTQTFSYSEARFHLQGRGFEGFKTKRMQDSRNGIHTQDYFKWLFPYTGRVYQSDIFQPNGTTLISQTINTWSAHSYASGFDARSFPYIIASTRTEREITNPYATFRTVSSSTTMDLW